MAWTRQTLSRDADANAADAPDAPPLAGKSGGDDDYNLPNGEEEDEAHALGNINALIRTGMMAMYIRVLGFKQGAATALYKDQQITGLDSLRKLDDLTIKELCQQIGKEGHLVLMILQNCLKLHVFWAKHMWRTSRGVDDLTEVDYDQDIKTSRLRRPLRIAWMTQKSLMPPR
jgi:hypothetical protein